MPKPKVRTGTPSAQLSREEFSRRVRERFYDPSFTAVASEIDRIVEVAWKNYSEYHKSPRTRRAGAGFSDPDFSLPIEWLETRNAIQQAEKRCKSPRSNSRILLINGSSPRLRGAFFLLPACGARFSPQVQGAILESER